MIVSFGSGVLIGTRTDTAAGVAASTPFNFGKIQECQMDVSFNTKMLYGQLQFPIDIARGQGKVVCKAKMAEISGLAANAFFFGAVGGVTAGSTTMQFSEAHVGAATVTIVPPASGTYVADAGVVYAATGIPLVLGTAAAGIYSVNQSTGAYTFAGTDIGKNLLITYTYSLSTTGEEFTLTNQLIGTTPTFSCVFHTIKNGLPIDVKLHNCVSSKYNFQTKLEDYTIPELDFDCFADAAGNVLDWYYSQTT